jgi:hypothetical protein
MRPPAEACSSICSRPTPCTSCHPCVTNDCTALTRISAGPASSHAQRCGHQQKPLAAYMYTCMRPTPRILFHPCDWLHCSAKMPAGCATMQPARRGLQQHVSMRPTPHDVIAVHVYTTAPSSSHAQRCGHLQKPAAAHTRDEEPHNVSRYLQAAQRYSHSQKPAAANAW